MTERNLFGPDAPDNTVGIFVAPSLVADVEERVVLAAVRYSIFVVAVCEVRRL